MKFCVASSGYRDLFISKGAKAEKITITGIPNFDNVKENMENDFPYKDFVLVATSSIRETLKMDNRIEFLLQAKEIAGDQQVIFKLHPNENHTRAGAEICKVFPQALIYSKGNIGHMIANCSCMVAQTSSCGLYGISPQQTTVFPILIIKHFKSCVLSRTVVYRQRILPMCVYTP